MYNNDNTNLNFLSMRNASYEIVEKIKTHILCPITFFSPPKIMPFVEKYGRTNRPQLAIQYGTENMQFSYRITKARIQTHTQNI